MTAAQVTPLVFVALTIFWTAVGISARAAAKEPHAPRALIEMTVERVLSALLVSIFAVIFWNTDHGYPLFDRDTGQLLGRWAPILFVAKPSIFIVAYFANWLRDKDYREAGRRLSR